MTDISALDRLGDALQEAVARHQATPAAHRHRHRRRIRWRVLAGVAAATLVVAVALALAPAGTPGAPELAAAKVTVHKTSDRYDIRLANVLADPRAIQEVLRRDGLEVTIQFVPASPSAVGKLGVGQTGSLSACRSTQRPRVTVRDNRSGKILGCGLLRDPRGVSLVYRQGASVGDDVVAVQVKLPFRDALQLTIGRRARPGERYAAGRADATAPGEALHCADIHGRRVRDILPELQRRHLRAHWLPWQVLPPPDQARGFVPLGQVLDRYVDAAVPLAPGEVMIRVASKQSAVHPYSPAELAQLRRGCPTP
jgi:hypothetical protein